MEPSRMLIVDGNQEYRRELATFFSAQDGIQVVGTMSNGLDALLFLREEAADIILSDIVMPQMDGLSLLEAMRIAPEGELKARPQVIMVTALSREDMVTRAMDLGVAYYLVKPVDMRNLLARVREVCGQRAPDLGQLVQLPGQHMPTLDEKLSNLFLTIGIPAHIKGFTFLREAVRIVVEDADVINRITKELYPRVAKRYSTSSSKVERAIRHAIEVAWNRGRIETLNRAFGCRVAMAEDKPTNGEFIAMIADKMRGEE